MLSSAWLAPVLCSRSAARKHRCPAATHHALKVSLSRCLRCGAATRRRRASSGLPEDRGEGEVVALRRSVLLRFVTEVQPSCLDSFAEKASPDVVDAMRSTVTNLVGSLPPQFFSITVASVSENLAQLLFSLVQTGYIFRSLQRRRDLKRRFQAPPAGRSLPTASGAPQSTALQQDTASDAYVLDLEREVARLRDEVASLQRGVAGRNELLEELRALEPANLAELTANAGEEVLESMNAFVKRIVGDGTGADVEGRSLTSAGELSRLLSWSLVVGYSLRTAQDSFDLDSALNSSRGGGNLPPPEQQ